MDHPSEGQSAVPRPSATLVLVALFFLLLGVGWLPEDSLKIPLLASASVGEVLLAWVALRGWWAARPRFLGLPWRSALDIAVLVLLGLVTLNVVRNLAEGYPALMVVRNARRMYYYTFFFALTAIMTDQEGRRRVVDGLNVLLLLGLLSFLFTAVTGAALASRIEVLYSPGGATQRIYHVVFPLAVVAGFLNFAMLLTKAETGLRVAPGLGLGAATLLVYLSFYRNYYVTFALGLVIILVVASGLRPARLLRAGIWLVVAAALASVSLSALGLLDPVLTRLSTIGAEVSGVEGTFASRLIVWGVRYQAITQINPLLGAGFIWEQDPLRSYEEIVLDPLVPDNDSGYGAALVLLGFIGIGLYALLYFIGAALAARALRRQPPPVDRAIALVAIALAPYVAVNSIGLDNFHWPYAVLPNLVVLAGVAMMAREPMDHAPEGLEGDAAL